MAAPVEGGATASDALPDLVAARGSDAPAPLVTDRIEQGLDHATKEAPAAHLRRQGADAGPLLRLARASSMLEGVVACWQAARIGGHRRLRPP